MKIQITTDFVAIGGVFYRRGSVLEYELNGYDKKMLVINGQAKWFTVEKPETKPEVKEEHDK